MQRIQLFDQPDRFVCGTIGEPGEREFFLQARKAERLTTVAIEKSQVQAIIDRLHSLVRQVQGEDRRNSLLEIARDTDPLQTPIEPEFKVGLIGISYDDSADCIQLDFQESVEATENFETEDLEIIETNTQLILRVRLSIGRTKAFIRRSESVIGAGRTPCPFCGGPIDPRGHLCPRANGYRR